MTLVWYVAVCHNCDPALPMPFADPRERERWVVAHREATGHMVTVHDEGGAEASE